MTRIKSDVQLMLEFQKGNVQAFRALVKRYQGPLVNFFYRLVWDRQLAEDYAQEVFCRVFTHRKSYKPQAKFSTYIFKIGRNYWIDRQRAKAHQPRFTSLNRRIYEGEGRDISLEDSLAAPPEVDLADVEQNQELVQRLKRALDSLPEEQRMVFVLSETQNMKYVEIAETLNIPVGTVKSRMHNAIKKLRLILAADADGKKAENHAV